MSYTPPEEELDIEVLLNNARTISLDFAEVKGLRPEDVILEIETNVVGLVSEDKPLEAYNYLTSMAIRVAHHKGLGDPERR